MQINFNTRKLEIFEVGPCKDAFEMGFLVGQRFSTQIKSRLQNDLILKQQLLPFAHSPHSNALLKSLSETNRKKYPNYWDELRGTAHGSGASLLEIVLLNFRKEILPFVPKVEENSVDDTIDDCSDVLVVGESMAIAAHNEDANVALIGHTYLIRGILANGVSFTAYTYAGELPSCAFGFNSHGLAFTLNSVPPSKDEIEAGGIGRNFISRDLLEAKSIDDALHRIYSSDASVGHSYNLIDVHTRRILNVETASRKRYSVYEVGEVPFFHANMYLHLKVVQEEDDNSLSRQKRAAMLPKGSRSDFLSLLGDKNDTKYPIYMTGPLLHTLCTVVIDLDDKASRSLKGTLKKEKPPLSSQYRNQMMVAQIPSLKIPPPHLITSVGWKFTCLFTRSYPTWKFIWFKFPKMAKSSEGNKVRQTSPFSTSTKVFACGNTTSAPLKCAVIGGALNPPFW